MEATGKVTSPIELLIVECAKTWAPELASALAQPGTPSAHALQPLLSRSREGRISSLPFIRERRNEVLWLSLGGDAKTLLEYGEDLRSWVIPAYGTLGSVDFVQSGSGRLMNLIQQVSPSGYLRWTSDLANLTPILTVLNRMHAFLTAIPQATNAVTPSLHALRFRFVTALRLGQWDVAWSVIGEIDRSNLEQGHKTMQMRVRVLGESGEYAGLLELVERHHLWALTQPTRVAEVILTAVVQNILIPMEESRSPEEVCDGLKPWYPKLLPLLSVVLPTPDLCRLFAYVACIDGDVVAGRSLLPLLEGELATFVRGNLSLPIEVPAGIPDAETANPVNAAVHRSESNGSRFWRSVKGLVLEGNNSSLRQKLDELDAQVLDDPEFLLLAPDAILELLSDPLTDGNVGSRVALQDVLTALIDTSFSVPDFPSLNQLELYISLAEALVYLRGDSAGDEDAQLLHGLLAAVAHLSPHAIGKCTDLLRSWWHRRPTMGRVGWLIGVLDSLAPLHPHPDTLLDLWAQAVEIATRKRLTLTPAQLRTWQRVARLLEIPAETSEADLFALYSPPAEAQEDAIAHAKLRKIAIVSLQEAAAREAARELEHRSGASVTLITGLVQSAFTAAAREADLILFVWAACSHAVYRAFDNCREKLAYVQGTGASSIVAAAEGWVEQRRGE
ncbi:hypothetical protein P5W98_00690 [Paraburkholderia sp. A1BS-2L]|uniref:hypothetical protein n=1 Tax=Paraburkholderia sp. A1BS-2L TaxID=3028373 RepID=UPI003DA934EE